MLLGNPHVETPIRHFFHHDVQGTSAWHGWRYTHDFWVPVCQFQYGMSEHILKFRWSVGFTLFDDFPGFFIEFPRGVPCCLVYLSLFETFSFHRDTV